MSTPFVVDNSVVMGWCFSDQGPGDKWGLLDRLKAHGALAPSVFPLELGNVLIVAERRKKLTRADAEHFLSLVRALPIRIEAEPVARQWGEVMALARQFTLSTYDASYLDLAMRSGLPLATTDDSLRKAAKAGRVELI